MLKKRNFDVLLFLCNIKTLFVVEQFQLIFHKNSYLPVLPRTTANQEQISYFYIDLNENIIINTFDILQNLDKNPPSGVNTEVKAKQIEQPIGIKCNGVNGKKKENISVYTLPQERTQVVTIGIKTIICFNIRQL